MDGHLTGALAQRTSQPSRQSRRTRQGTFALVAEALIVWDVLCVVVSGYGCALLHVHLIANPAVAPGFIAQARSLSLLGGLLAACIARGRDPAVMRQAIRGRWRPEALRAGLARIAVLLALMLAVMFLTRIGTEVPRLWMLMWAASLVTLTLGARLAWFAGLDRLEARGLLRERVAVVGSGVDARALASRLKRDHGAAIELVGVFESESDGRAEPDWMSTKSCESVIELGRGGLLDLVILAMPDADAQSHRSIVHALKALDVPVALCLRMGDADGQEGTLYRFGNTPMVLLASRPIGLWGLLAKDVLDKGVSLAALLVLSPLLLLIAAAIRHESPGPALFRQKRHGLNNTEFDVLKFRTMHASGAHGGDGRAQTLLRDRRVTRLGGFLRRSSLDELPQLINVLRGEMSLVGPRPHPCEMRTGERLGSEIAADYAHRHRVKPGITGWAQINGHRGATETAEQVLLRVEHDLHYIDNWSLLLDLRIIAITPFKLVFNQGRAY